MSYFVKKILKFIPFKIYKHLKKRNFVNKFISKMLEHLKPISQNHSISKAVATIFIAQPIIRPDLVLEKLNSKNVFPDYQKKTLSHLTTVQVNIDNQTILEDQNKRINGFMLESFDEKGKIQYIFRLQNGEDNNPSIIAFETRSYTTWENFYQKFKNDFSILSNEYNFFINAISLTYIDDFNWKSEELIPVNEIFNIDSEFLNQKFLDSRDGIITLFTQQNDQSEERTEITFSNRVKKILINHQFAKKLNNLESSNEYLNLDSFRQNFDEAHDANKDILRSLLSAEVQEIIKLNQNQ
jgi:uncharacterized protein (TIGR04255 family)